jgi:hypothetical protein
VRKGAAEWGEQRLATGLGPHLEIQQGFRISTKGNGGNRRSADLFRSVELLAAWRGYAGCEVLAIQNWATGRVDRMWILRC